MPTYGPLQHVEVAVHPLVARPLRDRDRGVVDDVDEAGRVALRRHVDTALCVGRRDETQRGMRQPVLLDGCQPVADLVGDVGVRMPDDLAELIDGVHFATHCYIILPDVHFAVVHACHTPPMTDVVQNPRHHPRAQPHRVVRRRVATRRRRPSALLDRPAGGRAETGALLPGDLRWPSATACRTTGWRPRRHRLTSAGR